jgi:hypothetical protein
MALTCKVESGREEELLGLMFHANFSANLDSTYGHRQLPQDGDRGVAIPRTPLPASFRVADDTFSNIIKGWH